jgi:hypothetical protein
MTSTVMIPQFPSPYPLTRLPSSSLQAGKYRTLDAFCADCRLIFDNAKLYNPERDPVYKSANILLERFNKKVRPLELSQITPTNGGGEKDEEEDEEEEDDEEEEESEEEVVGRRMTRRTSGRLQERSTRSSAGSTSPAKVIQRPTSLPAHKIFHCHRPPFLFATLALSSVLNPLILDFRLIAVDSLAGEAGKTERQWEEEG